MDMNFLVRTKANNEELNESDPKRRNTKHNTGRRVEGKELNPINDSQARLAHAIAFVGCVWIQRRRDDQET
jgi:hypothetical protein